MPHLLDNLRHGAEVLSADGKDLGKLHAVVIDPRDNEVTHIVVNAGPHFPEPGFGAPQLVEVPIAQMADAQEERVLLECNKQQFRSLPAYVERAYTQPPVSDAGGRGAGPGHLHLLEGAINAGGDPDPQGLQGGLLRREPSREVDRGVAARLAVGALLVREEVAGQRRMAEEQLLKPAQLHEVHALVNPHDQEMLRPPSIAMACPTM